MRQQRQKDGFKLCILKLPTAALTIRLVLILLLTCREAQSSCLSWPLPELNVSPMSSINTVPNDL